MKAISQALKDHYASGATTLATLWLLTRTDNVVMGFTDFDKNITYNGVTYQASTGYTRTAIKDTVGLNVDNLEVDGILDSAAITEDDLHAGLYDYATIVVMRINWADTSMGVEILRSGKLGEVSTTDTTFKAELRGLTQQLSQNLLEVYQPACRASLFDVRCGVNPAAYTVTGALTTGSTRHTIVDTSRTEANGTYNGGKLTMTSGLCIGLSMEVFSYTVGNISLVLALPRDVAIGDTYSLTRGCDKVFSTCKDTFNNVLNFRGEPHLPGMDQILKTGGV